MYNEEMVSIGKIENGYIISIKVPYKRDEDSMPMTRHASEEKQFHVADVAAMTAKLSMLIPTLEEKEDAEAAFNKSFKEAADDE